MQEPHLTEVTLMYVRKKFLSTGKPARKICIDLIRTKNPYLETLLGSNPGILGSAAI
jgi:hypothetical protein